jgi:hypothetical protein
LVVRSNISFVHSRDSPAVVSTIEETHTYKYMNGTPSRLSFSSSEPMKANLNQPDRARHLSFAKSPSELNPFGINSIQERHLSAVEEGHPEVENVSSIYCGRQLFRATRPEQRARCERWLHLKPGDSGILIWPSMAV